MGNVERIATELSTCLTDFIELGHGKRGEVFVVGCSTSEVVGERIGTAGTLEVAEAIFRELQLFQAQTGMDIAFQCCEHLNRALVVEREVAEKYHLEVVSVVPIRSAGGALATHAFHHMKDPVMVEFIQAHGGIDIGDTFIGMHLKHVAIPVRVSRQEIGRAHVTLATSRPKLIGGPRAIYDIRKEE